MNIFDLQATISLNGDAFMNGVQQAQTAFGSLGDTIKGTAIGKLAADAVEKGASAIVSFGKDSIQTGKAFESAMSQIAATLGMSTEDIANNVNGAGDSFAALKDTAATLGRETIFSATEAAEGLNILAMSGFSAEKAIEMLPTVLNLAAAGSMDMASAAGYISGTMKGFADDTKDAQYYADLMAQGATQANTSVSQLGNAMASGAAGASAFSQSAESMGIALLKLAEQNEVGSAAGTAYAALLQEVFTPKTDDAAAALKNLGVQTYDEYGKARDLNDIVNDLNAAMSDMDEESRNSTKSMLFGRQALDAYNKMTVTSVEKQNEWAESLQNASEGIGAAAQQYKTMTENTEGAFSGLESAMDGVKNAVFEKLSAPLQEAAGIAADALNKITEGFTAGGLKGAFESFGAFVSETFDGLWEKLNLPPGLTDGITAALETVKSAFSGLGDSFQPFVDAVTGAFSEAMPVVTGAVKNFLDAFGNADVSGVIESIAAGAKDLLSAFAEAGADVVEGISAAVGSFMDAFDRDTVSEIITSIANGAKNLFGAFNSARSELIEAAGSTIKDFLDAFSDSGIADIIADIAVNAGKFFGVISSVAAGIISDIASAIKTFLEGFDKSSAVGIIEALADGVGILFGFFTESLGGIIKSVGDAFSGFGDKLAELWNKAGPSMEETGEAVRAVIENIRVSVADFLKFVQPVIEWLTSVLSVTVQLAFEQLVVAVGAAWNAIMNVVTAMQDAFAGFVALLHGDVAGAAEAFQSAWENIVAFFKNIADFIVGPFKVIPQLLGDEGNKGVAAIKAPFEAAWSWFKDIGGQIIAGLKQGISDAWAGLTSWLSDKVSGLTDGIKNLFGIHSPSTVFAGIGKNLVLGLEKGWSAEFGGLEFQVDRDMRALTGTARIGFEDSAIGRSSAAGISSMFAASEGSGRGDPIAINLVLDGDVAATALYDPLRRTAFQKGQNAMEAAYA